jgi:hypothetical protein
MKIALLYLGTGISEKYKYFKMSLSFVVRSMNSNPILVLLVLISLETIPPTFTPLSFNSLATPITAVVLPTPGAPVRT